MKIAIDDITESATELSYTEEVADLNAQLGRGVRDYQVDDGLGVDVEYYRAGLDVVFRGALHGRVVATCARCLEEYRFPLERPFTFLLSPRAAGDDEGEITAEEIARTTYEGDEIDLTPLVYEEAMLALPTRPLCGEECLGLCARCGANLNAGPCGCPATPAEGRLAALLARPK